MIKELLKKIFFSCVKLGKCIISFYVNIKYAGSNSYVFNSGKRKYTLTTPKSELSGHIVALKIGLLKDFLTTKKLVIKYCGDNPTVIVAGAHVGYNELILSEIKGSLMFSFEPFPSTYEYLKMNIRDNGIQNVSIFNMGLSSKKENLRMGTAHKSGANSVLLGNASESYECKFDTVDNIMVEKEIKKLDLLKIDVEGHDIEVLKGAVNTIRKFKPAIQVEITKSDNAYFPNYDLDWLLKLLSEFSCEIFEIYKGKVIPVPDLNEFFKRNRIQNDLFIVIE